MEIITVDKSNIEEEHICCALADKKGDIGMSLKKAWLKERFKDGLVFKKLDARAKVLIEYIPATHAWTPVEANGYMHINCFWVSGQYKGKGYANKLLEECIKDAKDKGMVGITVIASTKKRPYLSDSKYLVYKGFKIADEVAPFFTLYYLPFFEDAPIPTFKECAKKQVIKEKGMVVYYTNQCPFTEKYANALLDIATQYGTSITLYKITSTKQAQSAPTPVTTYSFFDNGKLITNEIFSEKKFEKYLQEKGYTVL